MHLKLLLICSICCLLNTTYAQYENSFDGQTYIVRWASGTDDQIKQEYLALYRSEILCEMNFDGRQFAWLEFVDTFPQPIGPDLNTFQTIQNAVGHIGITGGVIGSQSPPVVDGSSLDYTSDHTNTTETTAENCSSAYDLTIPFGDNPVKLFNLDTGVEMPIDDSSDPNLGLDFSGSINCGNDTLFNLPICMDNNGHGTHGAGIQMSLFNKSIANFGESNPVDVISYRVFDDNGVGNLGAILCALDDIMTYPCPRKIVNCSFSFISDGTIQVFDPLKLAFMSMANANIFSVVAAGNDSTEVSQNFMPLPLGYFSEGIYPVNILSSTIGVGGTACDLSPAEYSNFSNRDVDISTIGVFPGPDLEDGPLAGITYYEGTSQATFASSAVAAMLMSHQPVVDLINLKCSMIRGSVYDPLFMQHNVASGILSASASLLLLNSGCVDQEECQALNVVTGKIGDGHYKSAGELHSNGYMQSDAVLFTAESSVTLMPGFQAMPNIQFHAYIEVCN